MDIIATPRPSPADRVGMPRSLPMSGQRDFETISEFFARRETENRGRLARENPQERQARSARDQAYRSFNDLGRGSRQPVVFEWNEVDGYWIRHRMTRAQANDIISAHRPYGGLRYDSFRNEIDACELWWTQVAAGPDDDSDNEIEYGFPDNGDSGERERSRTPDPPAPPYAPPLPSLSPAVVAPPPYEPPHPHPVGESSPGEIHRRPGSPMCISPPPYHGPPPSSQDDRLHLSTQQSSVMPLRGFPPASPASPHPRALSPARTAPSLSSSQLLPPQPSLHTARPLDAAANTSTHLSAPTANDVHVPELLVPLGPTSTNVGVEEPLASDNPADDTVPNASLAPIILERPVFVPVSGGHIRHAPSFAEEAATDSWSLASILCWRAGLRLEFVNTSLFDRRPAGDLAFLLHGPMSSMSPNHSAVADAASVFVPAVLARGTDTSRPPTEALRKMWDMIDHSRLHDWSGAPRPRIVRGGKSIVYIFTQESAGVGRETWHVVIEQASTALEIVRRRLSMATSPDILQHLYHLGAQFSVAVTRRGPCRLQFSPVSIRRFPHGYNITEDDYLRYCAERNAYIHVCGAVLLKQGGLVARIARDVLNGGVSWLGPSDRLRDFQEGEIVFMEDNGDYLLADCISETERDFVCGTYHVESGME